MDTAETAIKLCTKCGVNPKAGGDRDTNPWCLECRSEYRQKRYATLEWRAERRGLIRGIQAMREYLGDYFSRQGRAFMGPEVKAVIDSLPGPAVAPEDAKQV